MAIFAAGITQAYVTNNAQNKLILNGFADANALHQIYTTGQAPGSYPQVTSPYTYATSQRLIIGPLS